jgi:hypothetical protein
MKAKDVVSMIERRVVTNESFLPGATRGFLVAERHLRARRTNAVGVVMGYVPGHGGDVWWVQHHDDGTVGAYLDSEFEPA